MKGRDVTHVLFEGVVVRLVGRSVVVSVNGNEKVLRPEEAARLGRVLVSLGEGE